MLFSANSIQVCNFKPLQTSGTIVHSQILSKEEKRERHVDLCSISAIALKSGSSATFTLNDLRLTYDDPGSCVTFSLMEFLFETYEVRHNDAMQDHKSPLRRKKSNFSADSSTNYLTLDVNEHLKSEVHKEWISPNTRIDIPHDETKMQQSRNAVAFGEHHQLDSEQGLPKLKTHIVSEAITVSMTFKPSLKSSKPGDRVEEQISYVIRVEPVGIHVKENDIGKLFDNVKKLTSSFSSGKSSSREYFEHEFNSNNVWKDAQTVVNLKEKTHASSKNTLKSKEQRHRW